MGGHGATLQHAEVQRDETLQDPRCVFQVLKRHYARYTPEMVAAGLRRAGRTSSCRSARRSPRNSGRERTTAWVYSVGWTHHTVGVQYIRGAAIIQLLLGNMGRPGGGILALRGHASIQGSTDIPTLFNLLPGYLPMPKAGEHDDLDRLPRHHHQRRAEGLLGRRASPTRSACSRPSGATRPPPTTTSASTTCPG